MNRLTDETKEDIKVLTDAGVRLLLWIFIVIFLGVIIFLIIVPSSKDCADVPFRDIEGSNDTCFVTSDCEDIKSEFFMEQNLLTFRNEMQIFNFRNKKIGLYFQKVDIRDKEMRYAYIDENNNENVVGKIRKQGFLSATKYTFERCDGTGSEYRLEEKVITLDDVDYKLFRDNKLIGETTSQQFSLCNADISIVGLDGKLLALLSRKCKQSFLRDKWVILNYNLSLIDNYVIGAIGYITTLRENTDK